VEAGGRVIPGGFPKGGAPLVSKRHGSLGVKGRRSTSATATSKALTRTSRERLLQRGERGRSSSTRSCAQRGKGASSDDQQESRVQRVCTNGEKTRRRLPSAQKGESRHLHQKRKGNTGGPGHGETFSCPWFSVGTSKRDRKIRSSLTRK